MQLEKKLHSMHPHASFRLFLTMEINPKVNSITYKKYFQHFIILNRVQCFNDTSTSPRFPFLLSFLKVSVLCFPVRFQ